MYRIGYRYDDWGDKYHPEQPPVLTLDNIYPNLYLWKDDILWNPSNVNFPHCWRLYRIEYNPGNMLIHISDTEYERSKINWDNYDSLMYIASTTSGGLSQICVRNPKSIKSIELLRTNWRIK